MNRRARRHNSGFSLVELVATLTVVGILAAFAVPRMFDRTSFEARAVYDATQSAIRYGQKIAIAQRRSPPATPIYVVVTPAQVGVCYDAACATPVSDPVTGGPMLVAAPAGIALSPTTTFTFTGSGTPSIGARLAITVSSTAAGDVDRTLYVEAGTGYVHE